MNCCAGLPDWRAAGCAWRKKTRMCAVDILRSVRGLSADTHQHHFIGMYIGLALFRRGDLAGAALEWHEAMREAIAVGHLRGVAGSVEGCGYLAERLGEAEQACRFLSAAEQVRRRADSPLFSFWFRHNESANSRLRSTLGLDSLRGSGRRRARACARKTL